ncbi:hypothetical protein ABIA39_008077 [Nocardia sp. GAS34]|uniref:hypothetical protein n=1 Tax=unclassified Nocardia TaxID=2637762 RepID=UPI003D23CEC1
MSNEVRGAVVAELIRLAGSPDYRDRADAGRCLASFAEMPETRGPLVSLVLDTDDTFVTYATAEALLRRQDAAGFAVVAAGLASAGWEQSDWIYTAMRDVLGVFANDRDAALRECEKLAKVTDEQVRRGAGLLITTLAKIDTICLPVQDD